MLDESRSAARSVASHVRLPRGCSLTTGIGRSLLVAGVAAVNGDSRWGSLVFVIALIAAVGLQAVAMQRFRRPNSAWVNGMHRLRSTWPVLGVHAAVLIACMVLAVYGMLRSQGWIVLLACLVPLPVTYVNDRWWMRRYAAAFA